MTVAWLSMDHEVDCANVNAGILLSASATRRPIQDPQYASPSWLHHELRKARLIHRHGHDRKELKREIIARFTGS